MTNLEWLKNNDDLLEKYLCLGLAVHRETGRVSKCGGDVRCNNCLFDARYRGSSCGESRKEWLNKEHQSLYKIGDIVLTENGFIYFIIEESGNNYYVVTRNMNDFKYGIGILKSKEDIKTKIGNILDYYDEKEVK